MFTEGAVWDINSFDQWGVELGKELALSLVPIVSDAATGTNELDSSTAGLVAHMRELRGTGRERLTAFLACAAFDVRLRIGRLQ